MRRILGLVWTVVILTACGGGGGGSDGEASAPATYTISGTVSVPGMAVMDRDTPVGGVLVPVNNTEGQAQALPNPFVVGGFVAPATATGADANGNVFPTDEDDFYRVYLHAGDEVRLYSTDTAASVSRVTALALTLYPEGDPGSLKSATGNGPIKVTADSAGYHVLHVQLTSGSSAATYVLSLGGMGTSSATSNQQAFVPGEALVKFKAGVSSNRALSGAGEVVQGDDQFGYLVRQPALSARALSDASDAQAQTLAWIQSLRARPDVEYAEPNYLRRALYVPTDPYYTLQWALKETLNMEAAWDRLPNPGQGTVVAVIDSGIVKSHPDLANQLVPASDMYDFVSSAALDLDSQPGRDDDPSDPGDRVINGVQSSFHGTLVAGVIASLEGNSEGGASIAWDAKIMPLRVLGKNGEGSDADIIEAIKFAAGLSNASGRVPATPADVINLSLGQETDSAALRNAIDTVAALPNAPIMVAAAGNAGSTTPFYPAAYDNVVSVSAVTRSGTLAGYSNYGSTIDVAAPGGDTAEAILTTGAVEDLSNGGVIEPGTFLATGTSIAAPHVAAIAAMMRAELGPEFGPAEFKGILNDIVNDPGDPLKFGAGIIDGEKAAIKAQNLSASLLSSDVTSVSLSGPTDTATITLSKSGTQSLTVSSVTATTQNGGDWLDVQPATVDSEGYGTYTVSVKAGASLEDDTQFTGKITATTANNSVAVTVTYLRKTAAIDYGQAGTLYIQLYDSNNDKVAEKVVSSGEGADTSFMFDGLSAGTYSLLAATDVDDDLRLEPGEARAWYPTATTPQTITLGSDLTGIELELFYDTSSLVATTPAPPVPFTP